MTQNELREFIHASGKKMNMTGSGHDRVMNIIRIISDLNFHKDKLTPYAKREMYAGLIAVILEYHSSIIEVGKHRNTFPVFVRERAEWQRMEKIDETLMLFLVAQKIIFLPNFHFKEELLGTSLGILFGFCDFVGFKIEDHLQEQLGIIKA